MKNESLPLICLVFSILVHTGVLCGGNLFSFFDGNSCFEPVSINLVELEKPTLLPQISVIGEVQQIVPKQKSQEVLEKTDDLSSGVEALALKEKEVEAEQEKAKEAMLRYQDMIKQKIETFRSYPFLARRSKTEGTVNIAFIVLGNGVTRNLRIEKSSGSDLLDKEALKTINRASPFMPIPDSILQNVITIHVAIVFLLE